jgi:hypothetical protein
LSGRIAILQPDSVSFTTVLDGLVSPGYCESGMKSVHGEEFVSFVVDSHRPNQQYMYALTSLGNIAVFRYNLPSGKELNECEMKSIIQLPPSYVTNKIAMATLRGNIMLQN